MVSAEQFAQLIFSVLTSQAVSGILIVLLMGGGVILLAKADDCLIAWHFSQKETRRLVEELIESTRPTNAKPPTTFP